MRKGTYRLLDSGNGRKLEEVGRFRLIRPAPNAFWPPTLPENEWLKADGVFERPTNSPGSWKWNRKPPESWTLSHGGLELLVKPTGFGHLGFFAEQADCWDWLRSQSGTVPPDGETLNLFAYSGGSSLAMASAGFRVTHLDAAKGMVEWARENLELNRSIPPKIRWVVDDVVKFLRREVRRNQNYAGIVLDPPSFGRGKQGQVWKMESDIIPLLDDCRALLRRSGGRFVHLSCHSPGFTPEVLKRLLANRFSVPNHAIECGEMRIPEAGTDRILPAGAYARFAIRN
jgi:23S rRNA (cytosine1962-C5)-methyltransferase